MRKYSTPPWRVDWDTDIASVKSGNGKAVARCYQGDDDAVLIAAAPDLLRELEGCVKVLQGVVNDTLGDKTGRAAVCAAFALSAMGAIDKATK